MVKTRDQFKKIGDTKGIFHGKISTIKGQKWYGPHRSRRHKGETLLSIHRTIHKRS